jgi:asparagine synthase (glutamine-hydrolysing)
VAALARDVLASIVLHRRRPGFGLRRWAKRCFARPATGAPFPAWIDADFAARHALRARWDVWHRREPAAEHPLRPEAHGRLVRAPWAWYFEAFDPGVTRAPVEQRYPFLDVRLVKYLLAVPPIPWCVDKHLLRVAMRGSLPETIRVRPKAPLGGDPLRAHLRQSGAEAVEQFDPVAELAAFVNRAAIPPVAAAPSAEDTVLRVRPYCLDHWLRHRRASIAKESVHAHAG